LRDVEATARMHLTDYQVAIAELEAIIGAQVYPMPGEKIETANGRKGESPKIKGR
jgi:hypothetical protein